MTLKETYQKREESIKEALNLLESKIKRHRDDFNKNPNNWCYVGDLSFIEKNIREINQFLGTN